MSELKNCPFCGGDDIVPSQVCTDGGWGVLCRTCHTTLDARTDSPSEAIAAWNRRPSPKTEGVGLVEREKLSTRIFSVMERTSYPKGVMSMHIAALMGKVADAIADDIIAYRIIPANDREAG